MDVATHSQSPKNVLFVHYGDDWIRGSEVCLLNLITALPSQFRAIVWTNNPSLHNKAKELGVVSYLTSFSLLLGWSGAKYDIKQWASQVKQAIHLIEQEHIDLIHINSAAPSQWVSVAAMYKRIPFLTQLHSGYVARDRLSLLLHLNPHLVCVSNAVGEGMREDGYPLASLHTIHNGVPNRLDIENEFSVRTELGIADDYPILISIGSLIYRKGMDRLIDAVARKVKSGRPCHLVVLGEGEARDSLESLIAEKALSQFVHLVGEKNNVEQWLSGGVDAFVSGARSEAFGLVLVEAMLANVPVIAPNVGGIPEVVTDKVTGLLYPSDDNAACHIAALFTQLVNSESDAQRITRNAYHQATKHFSIANNTQQICDVYESLLSEPRPRLSLFSFLRVFKPLKTALRHLVDRLFRALPMKGVHHEY